MRARLLLAFALMLPVACADDDGGLPPTTPLTYGSAKWPTQAVDGAAVFALVGEDAVTDSVERWRLGNIRAEPTTRSVRVARLVASPDTLFTNGRAVAFDVTPARRLVFVGDVPSFSNPSAPAWVGKLQGGGVGQLVLVHTELGISGTIQVPGDGGALYRIQPLGASGLHVVVDFDSSKLPPGEG
jgi:hypothetical protein